MVFIYVLVVVCVRVVFFEIVIFRFEKFRVLKLGCIYKLINKVLMFEK